MSTASRYYDLNLDAADYSRRIKHERFPSFDEEYDESLTRKALGKARKQAHRSNRAAKFTQASYRRAA